jgi:hypothetical protein
MICFHSSESSIKQCHIQKKVAFSYVVRYIFQQNYSDIADRDMKEAEVNTGLVHKGLNLAFGCKFHVLTKTFI